MVFTCSLHVLKPMEFIFSRKVIGSGTQIPASPQMPTEETSGLIMSSSTNRGDALVLRAQVAYVLFDHFVGAQDKAPTIAFVHQDKGLGGIT